MRVTVLGCGGSGGVPLLGEDWGACDPANPRNRRRRVSVLVETGGKSILIDTSPDLRMQLLDAGVSKLDAVLYTHDHADHTHGIDDLRFLRRGRDLPPLEAYGRAATLETLARRFDYIFRQNEVGSGVLYRPFLVGREIDGPFRIGDVPVVPFEQDHGMGTPSTGYRIGGRNGTGGMAYSTDVVRLPEASLEQLHGLDLWVVDCLRFEPHPTHAHFDQVLDWVRLLEPKRTVLTHMNQTVDYEVLRRRCPPGIEPGYDGLAVEFPD